VRSRLTLLISAALLATLVLAAEPAAPSPAAGRFHSERGALGVGQRVILPLLRLPIEVLLSPFRLLDGRGEPARHVERDSGWTHVGFEVGDYTAGLYLKVKGKARFGKVEIEFEDGAIEHRDFPPEAEYPAGVYELARFERSRAVLRVRMEAQAVSERARVQVVLGHPR
jgi:hypothetical protein